MTFQPSLFPGSCGEENQGAAEEENAEETDRAERGAGGQGSGMTLTKHHESGISSWIKQTLVLSHTVDGGRLTAGHNMNVGVLMMRSKLVNIALYVFSLLVYNIVNQVCTRTLHNDLPVSHKTKQTTIRL